MKIFISADMEGVSGVTDWQDVQPGQRTYESCRKLLTEDVNAAIEGALEAGATEIVVNESHGSMRNLLVDELHTQAKLIRGFYKPMLMMQGVDDSFDAAFFIGYHGKAGANQAVMNHTLLSKCVQRFIINGEEAGEARLNATIAGAYQVPAILVTGDSQTVEEVSKDVPGIYTAAVKEGLGAFTASCYHPKVAQEIIKETSRKALQNIRKFEALKPEEKYIIDIEFKSTAMATVAHYIPGTEMFGGRTVRYQSSDIIQLMPVITAMLLLAIQVANSMKL